MSLSLRSLVALAVLALAALVPAVSAQGARVGTGQSAEHLGGVHIVKALPDGTLSCDVASEAELAEALAAEEAPVRLTVIPPLAEGRQPVSRFRIVLRATDQLIARPQALQAFRRAAARWERVIQSELTVVIDVDYGPLRFGSGEYPSGVIASANSALQFAGGGPSEIVTRLKARNTGDAQLQALYSAIPVPTPSTFPDGNGGQPLGQAIGGLIPLQALGVRPAATNPDPAVNPFGDVPNIGFNSAFNYDFDPNDGIGANQTDFEAVVAHEIGHAIAFTSAIGFTVTPPYFTPWDLFRVRPEAVTPGESLTDGAGWEQALRVVTPGPANSVVLAVEGGRTYFAPVQVTFDGNNEFETSTATGGRQGGDGQQASHWRDDALRPPSLGAARKIGIMDPTIGAGERIDLSFADIRLLQLTGYEVTFNPATATLALSVGDREITESLVVAEVALGDVAAGATRDVPVTFRNASAQNALEYEAQVLVDTALPAGVTPTVTLVQGSGTVAPSGTATATLRIGGVNQPAFVAGRLRVRSNDRARAFIEVPFTFSVGGAVEPTLALTAPASGALGDVAPNGSKSTTFRLQNTGTLPLNYVLIPGLAAAQFDFSTTPTARRATLFSASFESPADLSQFTFEGQGTPDRWQLTSNGRATLPGHSAPNAAYYRGVAANSFQYSNNSAGQLVTPDLNVSGLAADDLVQVSFNYFLKAQAGADIASVLISIDGGASYQTIATSDGGVLANTVGPNGTDLRWESATITVPGVAGRTQPVRIAFRFESDGSIVDEGWYIDDVVVTSTSGGASFFTSPADGTLAGGATRDVTVTANATALERGFYRGVVEVRSNQRNGQPERIDLPFTVGSPTVPTLAGGGQTASGAPGAVVPFTVPARNAGDALLTYVRVLEPAASNYGSGGTAIGSGVRPTGPVAAATVGADVTADAAEPASGAAVQALAEAVLPQATLPGDITQLPDGRVLVVDIGQASGGPESYGRTYLLPADLSSVTVIPSPDVVTTQVTALTYNERTGTIWMGELATGLLREFRLVETGTSPVLTPTGVVVELGLGMVGLTYSPELDAMFTTPFQGTSLFAIDTEGDVLPGYPVDVAGRTATSSILPGLSVTDGVVEISGNSLSILQVGQFGRSFAAAQTATASSASIGGSTRINGYLRSRLEPNGKAYYVANPVNGVSRVYLVDPPDLPASFGTRIEAGEPLFADQSVGPREEFELDLIFDGRGLAQGVYSEDLLFLTNRPSAPLVRLPVQISTFPVATDPSEPGGFALREPAPNPARTSTTVRFDLPAATPVSVEVYNTLGQRVAVLADGAALAAGPHEVPFETGALAAGVYVVRVVAGDRVATQKLTVLR